MEVYIPIKSKTIILVPKFSALILNQIDVYRIYYFSLNTFLCVFSAGNLLFIVNFKYVLIKP